MAIYKPSNCKPFLGSIDLTKEQYFQCEINTSNVPVAGYKIQILDSLNNVIFEGGQYTPLGNGNTGLNGSILSVPVVVTTATELNHNNIYYNASTQKWYRYGNTEVTNFFNGYVNQPYKWRINLAQGNIDNSQQPSAIWYDMIVATGQTMGSIPNRIQSILSENIYKDYYIQLCSSQYSESATAAQQAASFIGSRVRVIRYDNSFGYVYPEEGVFTPEQLSAASYFQIYKNTNNPEYVSSSRLVDYATTISMEDAEIELNGQTYTASFEPTLGTNPYYEQEYKNVSQEDANTFQPKVSYYDTEADPSVIMESRSTCLLIKNESSSEGVSSIPTSPKNGVFVFVGTSWTPNENDELGTLIVRWQRPADANSWGGIIGKVYYVQSGSSSGLNFESTAESNGVINSTSVSFVVEKPVELYPDNATWQGKNFGEIFKNTLTRTYVRPFVGLAMGMAMKYVLNNQEQSLIFMSVDTTQWYVTHSALTTPLVAGTPYTITSYFKLSDENPFYAYTTPTIEIKSDMLVDAVGGIYTVKNRYIQATGIYTQEQNKSWKNFQWSLLDSTINYTVFTEVSYLGDIAVTFEGLQETHKYELTLTVEDELGLLHAATVFFVVRVGTISDGGFPLQISFDCPTESVDINFVKAGAIIPNPTPDPIPAPVPNTGVSYGEGYMKIANATEDNNIAQREYGVKYEEVDLQIPTSSTESEPDEKNDLPGPETNNMTINSQHILNSYFTGTVFEVLIRVTDQGVTQNRIKVRGVLPYEVIKGENSYTIANPERNQIIVEYWQESSLDGGTTWNMVPDTMNRDYAVIITDEGQSDTWRLSLDTQDDRIVFAKANKKTVASDVYDYLLTDKAYNITVENPIPEHTEYRNLVNSYYNCSDGIMRFPLGEPDPEAGHTVREQDFEVISSKEPKAVFFYTREDPDNDTRFYQFEVLDYTVRFNVWTDNVLKLATQLDGTKLNVEDVKVFYVWDETDSSTVWSDSYWSNAQKYHQVDINLAENHSGRQEIANKVLTFNVAISNFDPMQISVSKILEIVRQCFMHQNNPQGGE